MSNKLKKAIILACIVHKKQIDKSGNPYILHPLSVMLDNNLTTENEMIVAVLHDTIEDTNLTLEYISTRFNKEIVDAINAITRRDKEIYMDYIKRCSLNHIAKKVKIADLKHNMTPNRMLNLHDNGLMKRYIKALKYLETENK